MENLVHLCSFHHRELHEGGCRVERDAKGEIVFKNRWDLLLENAPGPPQPGSVDRLLHENEMLGIDARTITLWNGDPIDYGTTIMALFWERREQVRSAMRFLVLGHAALEQALDPRPGITCKALFVDPAGDADAQAADWLARLPAGASPHLLAPLPVFGYPGWLPGGARAGFYDDARFFRPSRREPAADG